MMREAFPFASFRFGCAVSTDDHSRALGCLWKASRLASPVNDIFEEWGTELSAWSHSHMCTGRGDSTNNKRLLV